MSTDGLCTSITLNKEMTNKNSHLILSVFLNWWVVELAVTEKCHYVRTNVGTLGYIDKQCRQYPQIDLFLNIDLNLNFNKT